jgi:hypothetical protein
MNLDPAIRDFYTQTAKMTDPAPHGAAFVDLPPGLEALVPIVQGVLIHRDFAPFYGAKFSTERVEETHIRSVSQRLERIFALENAPIRRARAPERRSVGTCRDFTVMTVAMLRAQGLPARARCGFGAYFRAGQFEDHWVVEYWRDGRWRLADAQIDDVQSEVLKPAFDLMDVPRDQFVVAGDAWKRWREGRNKAEQFGIFDIRGASFIAGNLVHDFAALNNMESLPWDVWGPMTMSDDAKLAPNLDLFDRLAELGCEAADRFPEIRSLYEADDRLPLPGVVYNAIRQREEAV